MFTHLLHEETYCYLVEARRVVKPGGRIVFSFLEFENNWPIFEDTYKINAGGSNVHLNMFIGRDAITGWVAHLGMSIVEIRAATDPFIALSRPIVYDDGRRVEGIGGSRAIDLRAVERQAFGSRAAAQQVVASEARIASPTI